MLRARKRLVIDASIAASAGGRMATDHLSRSCRDVLDQVRKLCHQIVMSDPVEAEWNNHQSLYARSWLGAMKARGKIMQVTGAPDTSLRDQLHDILTDEHVRAIVLHDIHVVEAARDADSIILSSDERVRRHLRSVACNVAKLSSLVWVDPTQPDEQTIAWLRSGARTEALRRLCTD
jgi:hypothetical protein